PRTRKSPARAAARSTASMEQIGNYCANSQRPRSQTDIPQPIASASVDLRIVASLCHWKAFWLEPGAQRSLRSGNHGRFCHLYRTRRRSWSRPLSGGRGTDGERGFELPPDSGVLLSRRLRCAYCTRAAVGKTPERAF